ncbi:TipAS antibiotic-recognition domain-containing protein [Actinocrinis puniceicyclus]|uniref:TipAS antibiotic-recognition domain-containing protein n=1 Tax=Actinocrinis puniceicyclus TaxID=977794 RepID=A0A8J7WPS5_9ACTN|nr:TipAS antibiotic-recognition domain-containing protein [Actinocrinis puniceicyclus]MBS2963289.1 TipAS antibiotic-recognition domain-containing protein [Actinocrinis puniceicyclus]
MSWTIAQVARLSRITTRTLRHYDAIGLLRPAGTGPGGVRMYEREQLLRLQRILLLRDLGLGLDAIASVIDDQDRRGTREVLGRHRAWLLAESERLARLAGTVQLTIDELSGGAQMDVEELFEGFDPARYEREVEQRWPLAAAESRRRTGDWSRREFAGAAQRGVDLARRFAGFAAGSVPVDDARTQEAVAEHYQWVCLFWTPDAAAYRGLGEMYVADERFRQYYDKHGRGTAQYVCDAMAVYAAANLP